MATVKTFTEVHIEQKAQSKGRAFRATYLASAVADDLWQRGAKDRDIDRPVFAVFAGSDAELRPFVANLMLGRRVLAPQGGFRKRSVKGFEFMKSAGYKIIWQREEEGSIATVFLPELFLIDPGMVDPKEAKFVVLPSVAWAEAQEIDTVSIVKYAKKLPLVRALNTPPKDTWAREHWEKPLPDEKLTLMVATSYLFAAFLDRRTRAPLLADGRFYLQLLLACLKAKLATWSGTGSSYYREETFGQGDLGFSEDGAEDAGLLPGVAFKSDHATLEALLAEEVATFFKMTGG